MKRKGPDTKAVSTRELALRILYEYEDRGAFLNSVLRRLLSGGVLDRRDRAFVTELVQGSVRMKKALDHMIRQFSDVPLERVPRRLLWVLRIGAYQVIYMGLPEHAACNTSTELARSFSGERASAFANAVLRNLCRNRGSIFWPSMDEDPVRAISVTYSHPEWVVEMWIEELGLEKTERLCAADNALDYVSVRVNLTKTSVDELKKKLREKGIETRRSRLAPEGLLLKGPGAIHELEEFKDGLVSVQDESSMIVSHALSPEPGMSVLDMCAAPGGKATHIAELMGNEGRILALDVNEARLSLLEENVRRLGATIVEARVLDSTTASSKLRESFHRVVVDAPCSALGTLRRRPDVRWRRKKEELDELVPVQMKMLREGAELLEEGGVLVYSVCTISRKESFELVDGFLKERPEFGKEPVESAGLISMPSGEIQLFPDEQGCEGMYIVRLRKEAGIKRR